MMINLLGELLASAGISSTRECSFVLAPPGKSYVAPDLYVSEFPGGSRVAYDVSYCHPFDWHGGAKWPDRVLMAAVIKRITPT